jgi:hypothetical protein
MFDFDHPKARWLGLDPTAGLRLAGEGFGDQTIESESPSASTRPEVCSFLTLP